MAVQAHARLANWSDSVEILFYEQAPGVRWVAQPLMLVMAEEGAYAEPTLTIERYAAQALMDQLWLCGLRPTEGTGSAGSLKATQDHLEDMRSLTFGLVNALGVKGVKGG